MPENYHQRCKEMERMLGNIFSWMLKSQASDETYQNSKRLYEAYKASGNEMYYRELRRTCLYYAYCETPLNPGGYG